MQACYREGEVAAAVAAASESGWWERTEPTRGARVCVCARACSCESVPLCAHVCIRVCLCVSVFFVCLCACLHWCASDHVCVFDGVCLSGRVSVCLCVSVCLNVSFLPCVCLCVCLALCVNVRAAQTYRRSFSASLELVTAHFNSISTYYLPGTVLDAESDPRVKPKPYPLGGGDGAESFQLGFPPAGEGCCINHTGSEGPLAGCVYYFLCMS